MKRRAPSRRMRFLPLWLGLAGVLTLTVASLLPERVPPPPPLRVQALDAAGRILAGIQVRFFPRVRGVPGTPIERATGPDGIAEIPGEAAPGGAYCLARDPTGVCAHTFVDLIDGGRPVPLEFGEARILRGTVRDERGLPIEGASVIVRIEKSPALASATTDAYGRFALGPVSTSVGVLTVVVARAGFATAEREWLRDGDEDLDFLLERTDPLRVRVVDPNGAPVPGAELRVLGRPELDTSTGPDGVARFDGLARSEAIYVRVRNTTLTHRCDPLSPSAELQEIVLEPPAELRGRILDAEGRALSGVEIRHHHGPRGWVRARSDGAGRFVLGGLPSGEIELRYSLPGGRVGRARVALARGERKRGFLIRVPAQR